MEARRSARTLRVKPGPISLLIANPRPAFDAAAHFHCRETTNLTLPAAIPADSLVYLRPNLVLARFALKGIFSECFIPSTTGTSKHDKTPVGPYICHKSLLRNRAIVSNLTWSLRPTTGVGQRHLAGRLRGDRHEQLGQGSHNHRGHAESDTVALPGGAYLLGSAHAR